MNHNHRERVEWFVIFTESELDHWLIRRLKKGFRHVYAVKRSEGGNFWVVVNPLKSHLDVELIPTMDSPHIRLLVGQEAIVLPVVSHITPTLNRRSLCLFTCVDVVKSLLGVRWFWVFTPWQLYKKLKEVIVA